MLKNVAGLVHVAFQNRLLYFQQYLAVAVLSFLYYVEPRGVEPLTS